MRAPWDTGVLIGIHKIAGHPDRSCTARTYSAILIWKHVPRPIVLDDANTCGAVSKRHGDPEGDVWSGPDQTSSRDKNACLGGGIDENLRTALAGKKKKKKK